MCDPCATSTETTGSAGRGVGQAGDMEFLDEVWCDYGPKGFGAVAEQMLIFACVKYTCLPLPLTYICNSCTKGRCSSNSTSNNWSPPCTTSTVGKLNILSFTIFHSPGCSVLQAFSNFLGYLKRCAVGMPQHVTTSPNHYTSQVPFLSQGISHCHSLSSCFPHIAVAILCCGMH